ncbi:hypothetical protein [Oerskovia turbata]
MTTRSGDTGARERGTTPTRPTAAARAHVFVALGVLGALTLSACGAGDPQRRRAEWILGVADGATLAVGVYAGGSTCVDYDGVEVEEGAEAVEVRAYVWQTEGACSEDFGVKVVEVELDEPLGDRSLVGCAGPEVTVKGWNLPTGADCAEPKPGLLPGTFDPPGG